MILSSSDILRVLRADAIIRQEATVSVVDGRPGLGTEDIVYIYIEKYPTIDEFEATWKIWVQDVSGMGEYVLNAMTSLLPNFDFKGDHYSTTDFASERTVIKTQAEIEQEEARAERKEFSNRFSGLQKGLEERLSTITNGVDGRDGRDGIDGLAGKDGRDGRDGRDGKDIEASETELEELANVEEGIAKTKGQVLTWDGIKWTNLFVPQSVKVGGGGNGGGGTGSVDNVTIISETTPVTRDDGSDLIQGDSWYIQSTDQLFLYIDGAWEEIKDGGGVGGVLNSYWKFKDDESTGWDDGKFRVNSHQGKTDWSLTTEVYLAYKNDDGNNTKNYILQLIKPGQLLYVQRRDRPDAFAIFEVQSVPVDADVKGATISVSFVTQGPDISDITNDKLCGLTFSLVSGNGGGGGSTTLAELTDTNVTNPQNTDILVYRNGFWTSEAPASTCDYTVSDGGDFDSGTAQETGCDGIGIVGVVEMDDLSDVDLTTAAPADNDLLVYDQASGNWLPTPNTVRNLGDFDGTLLEEGATIVWDAVNQIFKQAQAGSDGITSAAYKFKDTLTGDPSNGHIALNNADPALATEIRVHKTTTNGVDLSAVFNMGLGLAQGLYIQRKDDASEAHAYRTSGPAVDQGNYIAVPIEHVGGTGTFTKNKIMVIGVYARSEARKISPVPAPASSTSTGEEGEVRYDADYLYVCVATNTWRRFTLENW